ncbi:MAG: hypothetical protein JWN51_2308, partial [Phycisphaerales bacterium]|nr:hypothetical protein [Phycisphaerales bacterium]
MRRTRLGARSIRGNGVGRQRKMGVVRAAVEGLESRTMLSTSVLTYHNNNQTTGVNNTETLLTPSSVNVSQFRKQFTVGMDGQVYAQPLYVPNLNITTGAQPGIHNVAFVATEHDSLYAIDTNGGSQLWHDSFIFNAAGNPNPLNPAVPSGVTTMPSGDTGSGDITVEVGITSTPVIDAAANAIYVAAKTKKIDAANFVHYVYTLYKINIQNGAILSSTVMGDTINSGGAYYYRTTGTATDPFVNGTGDGNITSQVAFDGMTAGSWGGTNRVYFNAQRQLNRPGLVLVTNPDSTKSLYIAFASHGDNGPYHGWVLRYDAANLALNGVVNTTPNGGLGGIWQGGGITAVDAAGNLYCETGNGSFNGAASNFSVTNNGTTYSLPLDHNYGDCFIKISADTTHNSPSNQNANGWGLQISDFFSPQNNATLNAGDTDLGSGGPTLLPDGVGSTAHAHLLIGAGKEGKIYLIDRDKMGGFSPTTDFVVQEQANSGGGGINGSLNTPGFFFNNPSPVAPAKPSGVLYYFPGYGGDGRAFTVTNGTFSTTYTSHTTDASSFNSLDGTPSISANGTTNGIVWVIDRGTNTLRAYNAGNLATALWNSNAAANSRDATGAVTKFSVPTIADGLVMMGTLNQFIVFGPPITPTAGPAAPTGLTAAAPNFQTVNLTWVDNSNNEDQFNIERSPAGQNTWAQVGIASSNATSFTDSTTQATTAYDYRVRAFNSFNAGTYSSYTNTATVTTPAAPPIGTGDGALAAYYNDTGGVHISGTPTLTRVDPLINFSWGTGSPDPSIGVDHFSAKWTGQIQAQYSEVYTFFTESDDGVKLFVNGQLLINNFTDHGPTEDIGTITLSGGQKYSFEMDYYENGGGATAQLLWASISTPKAFVPQLQLYSGVTPTAPSNLAGVASSGTQINLTWNDNSNNETGFDLERMVVGNGTFQPIGGGPLAPNTTSFMDTGLTPGVTYAYEIRALNFGGNSAYVPQPPLQITAPLPPNKPTNAVVTGTTTGQISLAWQDNSNNEEGFRILRENSISGGFNQIALLPPNTTTFTDTGTQASPLTAGTEYEYHIQAFNVAGYLDFTGVDTATLTLAPTNLMASGGNGQVALTWTAPSYSAFNSTQLTFNVYRGTSANGEAALAIATGLTTPAFTDTGLTKGTTYYSKVTAVEVGGESARSNETLMTPSGTPVTPAINPVSAPAPLPEGNTLAAFTVTFTGTAGDAFTASVDFGDGSPVVHPAVSGNAFTVPAHAYAEEGAYTLTLAVADTTNSLSSAPRSVPLTVTPVAVQASIGGVTPVLTLGASESLTFSAVNPNALEMGPLI